MAGFIGVWDGEIFEGLAMEYELQLLIPHPSSLTPHPSSLIPHPLPESIFAL
jgi:hypothetical protein